MDMNKGKHSTQPERVRKETHMKFLEIIRGMKKLQDANSDRMFDLMVYAAEYDNWNYIFQSTKDESLGYAAEVAEDNLIDAMEDFDMDQAEKAMAAYRAVRRLAGKHMVLTYLHKNENKNLLKRLEVWVYGN